MSHYSERELLAIYDRMAGQDDLIDSLHNTVVDLAQDIGKAKTEIRLLQALSEALDALADARSIH